MRSLPLLAPGRPHRGPSSTVTHAEPRRDTPQGWGVPTLPTDASGFLPSRPATRSPRQAIHLAPTGKSSCRRPARVVDVDHPIPEHHYPLAEGELPPGVLRVWLRRLQSLAEAHESGLGRGGTEGDRRPRTTELPVSPTARSSNGSRALTRNYGKLWKSEGRAHGPADRSHADRAEADQPTRLLIRVESGRGTPANAEGHAAGSPRRAAPGAPRKLPGGGRARAYLACRAGFAGRGIPVARATKFQTRVGVRRETLSRVGLLAYRHLRTRPLALSVHAPLPTAVQPSIVMLRSTEGRLLPLRSTSLARRRVL